jgi:quercetin dioxygenase-like cupin family protein
MGRAGTTIWDPHTGQRLTFLETAAETQGESLRVEVALDPGGRVPRHLHLRQDERLEVLEGGVRFRCAGEEKRLGRGDSVAVPRRRIHTVSNDGPGTARFVLEVRPAGHTAAKMATVLAAGRIFHTLLHRRSRDRRGALEDRPSGSDERG